MNHDNHEELNGRTNGTPVEGAPPRALEVLSIKAGTSYIVRLLDYNGRGLYTHYVRGRSHFCPGKECNCQWHKFPRIWKGYAPVQVLNQVRKKWMAFCLEITEKLELDFRDVAERGQLWELFRPALSSKKAEPVQGRLLPEGVDPKLPPAFSFMPCLYHLYHSNDVRLEFPNPLPPRVIVVEQDAEIPECLRPKSEAKPIPDGYSFAEEAARRKRMAQEKKSPMADRAARN